MANFPLEQILFQEWFIINFYSLLFKLGIAPFHFWLPLYILIPHLL